MEYQTIILEKKGGIATITMNRPEKLNALSNQMGIELTDAFRAVQHDEQVRVLVITGAGRGFSSGLDIRESQQAKADKRRGLEERMLGFAAIAPLILNGLGKPVIAAINGIAVGFGCTLTLVCDIRIASEEARFAVPFPRIGVSPEFGSSYFLSRVIGIGKACELVFTGRTINAKEAKEIGLVNQVVPASELSKTVYEMAGTMAESSPVAMLLSKKGLYQGLNADLATQLQYEAFANHYLRGAEDFKEAARAFLEKR